MGYRSEGWNKKSVGGGRSEREKNRGTCGGGIRGVMGVGEKVRGVLLKVVDGGWRLVLPPLWKKAEVDSLTPPPTALSPFLLC